MYIAELIKLNILKPIKISLLKMFEIFCIYNKNVVLLALHVIKL